MAKLSIKSIVTAVQSLVPAARTASASGSGVDLQGFDSALCVVSFGVITDGTHTPKLQESSDNSTFTDVASTDLDGSFSAGSSSSIQQVGYIGKQRYIRVYLTVSGATTGGLSEAILIKGNPRHV